MYIMEKYILGIEVQGFILQPGGSVTDQNT